MISRYLPRTGLRARPLALIGLIAGVSALSCASPALGALYEAPAGSADSSNGTCTRTAGAAFACTNLRAALRYADTEPGSTIRLEPGVYQVGGAPGPGVLGFLAPDASVRITGAGPAKTTIRQTSGLDPVFVIPRNESSLPWEISIEDLTLTGGVAAGRGDGEVFGGEQGGGALRVNGSKTPTSVTLLDDALVDNRAQAQTADGGAIFNKGTLNIIDTTIAHNTALAEGASSRAESGEAQGGGIFNVGTLLIADSTIADNTVQAGGLESAATGGGIDSGIENFSNDARLTVANTTITGNIASAGTTEDPPLVEGGGIAIDSGELSHVTLDGNIASPTNAWKAWGGNLFEPDGRGSRFTSSIIADGAASQGADCQFTGPDSEPEHQRYDLEDDSGFSPECGFSVDYDSIAGVSPQLKPLAPNGGPTETLAPAPASPVIEAGTECSGTFATIATGWESIAISLAVDERGMPRDGHCDIGAFQTEPPASIAAPTIQGTAEVGQTLACQPGSWTGEGTLTYAYEWLRNGVWTGDTTASHVLGADDAGSKITCLVTAAGTYGSTEAESPALEVTSAASPQAKTAPNGTTGSAGTGSLGSTANGSAGQIARKLRGALLSDRAQETITKLLRHDGLQMSFTTLAPGVITVDWYAYPAGSGHDHARVLLAHGRRTFAAATTQEIKITLTAAGRKLLRDAARLRITAEAVLASAGQPEETASRTILLTR